MTKCGSLLAGQERLPDVLRGSGKSLMSRGKAASQRQLRVGEELRHALAHIMTRTQLQDPALKDVVLTVTEVRASPDLKSARAFVVPLGGGEPEPIVAALNRARGYFRGELGREVKLRYTPAITFEPDGSFDTAQKIEDILNQLRAAPKNTF